jgi:hypothetical protein
MKVMIGARQTGPATRQGEMRVRVRDNMTALVWSGKQDVHLLSCTFLQQKALSVMEMPCFERNSVALVTELNRPSDRSLSVKLVPMFMDGGLHVVSATDPHSRILDFLDWSNFSF